MSLRQAFGGLAFIVLVFLIINYIHFQYFPVSVILYDSVIDIVLSVIIFLVWSVLGKNVWRWSERLVIAMLGSSLALNIAIMVPTVIDRSLSIYILEKLNKRGGEISFKAWDALLKEEFFDEYKIVDIRMTEQINSGTVVVVDGCVKLTSKGHLIAEISSFYRRNFLPRHRDIMGEYSDALRDPLKFDLRKVDTECKKVD